MNQTPPDSKRATLDHIYRVQELIGYAMLNMSDRSIKHDLSKLEEPEKSAFDRLEALKLSNLVYGSPEYRAALAAEKPAINHHYSVNSHHPEFHEQGVDGMSLMDVMEMLCDWKAATERMRDGGDIEKSIEHNTERFKLSPQLAQILRNTVREMGWGK